MIGHDVQRISSDVSVVSPTPVAFCLINIKAIWAGQTTDHQFNYCQTRIHGVWTDNLCSRRAPPTWHEQWWGTRGHSAIWPLIKQRKMKLLLNTIFIKERQLEGYSLCSCMSLTNADSLVFIWVNTTHMPACLLNIYICYLKYDCCMLAAIWLYLLYVLSVFPTTWSSHRVIIPFYCRSPIHLFTIYHIFGE